MKKHYRALVDMALRKAPDPKSPLWNEEYSWPAGTVFEAPAHLNIQRALERGIMEEVTDG